MWLALDEPYEILENKNELFTLTDLYDKFKDLVGGDEVLDPKYIKQKLIQKYGDRNIGQKLSEMKYNNLYVLTCQKQFICLLLMWRT